MRQAKAMTIQQNTFLKGITDSIPIFLGYLSVSFAFGIFTVESGLSALEALLISMTNVTSAGQLALVPIIAGGGTILELASTLFVINLRYALMSVSLSQKLHRNVRLIDRFIISFINTDEVFGVSSSKNCKVKRNYMFGLIILPYIGWALGTILGAVAGNILPVSVVSALGVAIYAMFVAIVVPEAKKRLSTAFCVLLAIVLCIPFHTIEFLKNVQSGFVIIICSVIASAVFALTHPIEEAENDD